MALSMLRISLMSSGMATNGMGAGKIRRLVSSGVLCNVLSRFTNDSVM